MIDTRPGRDAEQFNLRMPDGMRDRIKTAAEANGRSMNAEIVAALDEKYPERQIEVKAVDGVLHYILAAKSPKARRERAQEVNDRFARIGSPLRVELTDEGARIVALDP